MRIKILLFFLLKFSYKNFLIKIFLIIFFRNLELLKSKKDIEILNSDDHQKQIKSMKKTYEEFRPDVTYQVNQ